MSRLNILLVFSLFFALSCGSENSSGGAPASTTNTNIGISDDGTIEPGNSSQVYGSIEELRSAFNSMSLETGVNTNSNFYHVGSKYQNGGSGWIDIDFCLFNCNQIEFQLEQVLKYGRVIKIQSLNQDSESLSLGRANGVENNDFTYENYTYTRNNHEYQSMLGFNLNFNEVKFSKATISLSDGSSVLGVLVDYRTLNTFNGALIARKRYVLSTNLPVVANPIAETEESSNQASVVANLKQIGINLYVTRIDIEEINQNSDGSTSTNNWTLPLN